MLTAQQVDTLNTAFGQAVATANNPEDAARIFGKVATAAIGQALADALLNVLSQVSAAQPVGAVNPIQGWEKYITGASLCINWPSPGLSPGSILPALSFVGAESAGVVHPAGVGVSVGISITGTF